MSNDMGQSELHKEGRFPSVGKQTQADDENGKRKLFVIAETICQNKDPFGIRLKINN